MVKRPRLFRMLDEGTKGRLLLLSASAGYGKTSLLSDWALHQTYPVYWLNLDSEDEDPIRFVAYLIETLQHLPHSLRQDLSTLLQAPNQDTNTLVEVVLTRLLRGFKEAETSFCLILDDYHAINSPAIHKAVAFLVDQAPPPCHLVISTRQDPPFSLSKLRLEDQLFEMRNEDLCFTDEESREFFDKISAQSLSEEESFRLNQLTEGWIAGIKLVSLSLKKSLAPDAFISRFKGRNRDIFDYLSEQLLCLQAPETRDFLLKTAILNSFTASLCQEVTGCEHSQQTLEALEKANLFIVPLDRERSWYRYHHLFSAFLFSHLQKTAPEEISVLHQRAANWYNKEGDPAGAIWHYLEAHDYEQAGALIQDLGKELLMRGEVATLRGWLDRIPEDWLLQKPSLCMLMAWSIVHVNASAECAAYISAAEKDKSIRPQVLAFQVVKASSQGENCYDLALEAFDALEGLTVKDLYSYNLVSLNLGFQYARQGRLQEGSEIYKKTERSSWAAGDLFTNVLTLSFLAQNERALGHLNQGIEYSHQALVNAGAHRGEALPVASIAYMVLGNTLYDQHYLEEARHNLEESIRLDRLWCNPDDLLFRMLILLKVAKANGDSIAELLAEIDSLVREPSLAQYRPWVALAKAQIAKQEEDIESLERWVEERGPINPKGRIFPLLEEELVLLADFQLLKGESDEALAIADMLLNEAQVTKSLRTTLYGKILQILGLSQKGEGNEVSALLNEAYTLAQPQNFISPFTERGKAIIPLLIDFLEQQEGEFSQRFLSILKKKQVLDLIGQLTEREREVLAHILKGTKNEAIAQDLYVTPSTVKKHIQNIYGKLNISNRQEALRCLNGISFE